MNNICIWQLSIWTLSGKPPALTWKTKTKLWERGSSPPEDIGTSLVSSTVNYDWRYLAGFPLTHVKGCLPEIYTWNISALREPDLWDCCAGYHCQRGWFSWGVNRGDTYSSEHLLIFSETVTNDFLLHHLRLLRYKIWIMVPPTPKIFFLTILQGVHNLHLLFDWWVFEYFFFVLCV